MTRSFVVLGGAPSWRGGLRGPSPIDSALGAHHKILTQNACCLPARWAHAYPAQPVTCRDLKLGRPWCRSARRPCHETESVGWHSVLCLFHVGYTRIAHSFDPVIVCCGESAGQFACGRTRVPSLSMLRDLHIEWP